MVMMIPVYIGVGKGIQTTFLAAERNKDWTVMKVLLEDGLEPVGSGKRALFMLVGGKAL